MEPIAIRCLHGGGNPGNASDAGDHAEAGGNLGRGAVEGDGATGPGPTTATARSRRKGTTQRNH